MGGNTFKSERFYILNVDLVISLSSLCFVSNAFFPLLLFSLSLSLSGSYESPSSSQCTFVLLLYRFFLMQKNRGAVVDCNLKAKDEEVGGGEEGKKGPALSPLVSSMSDNRTKKTQFSHAYLVDFVPCMNDRKEASLVLLHTFIQHAEEII